MLGLVTLLLLILLAVGAVLGTHTGSRWVLNKVPGVEVEQFHGRLGGEWQAERLTWQQGANRAVVDAPRMAWSPMCLLRMTLCIEELVVGDIDLQFPPTAEDDAPSEPFSLPDVKLPLELRIERIEIGELRLNDVQQLRSLQLRADWRKEGLEISALQVRRDDLSLDLTGRLQPNGDWPLELSGTAAIRSPDAQPWALMLAVNGELRDQLHLNVESQGYLDARLSGQLSPLASELPAQLRVVVERFKATPELPDGLRLDTLELSAEGDLEQGYRLVGDGRLQGEGGAVGIALNALVDAKHAEVEALQLDAGEGQRISLNGQADWQEGLTGEAELAWRDFPWRRLYPDVDEPPVALRTLDAQIQYDDGNYLGNFDAALTGPSGEFTLRSPVSGDLEVVHLPQLELQAGQGRAAGNLSVGFADGIEWNTRLDMSELDPSFWVAELPGQLAGTLSSRGTMRDEQLQAEARLDLTGTLRQQPLKLQLEASGQGAAWDVPLVDLHLGDNRIQGSGRWAETLQANLELNLSRLAQLWPDLQGQLAGDLKLAGTPQTPEGTLALEGSQVAFQQNRIEHLELAASLEQGERGQLRLVADGLRAGDTELGRLQVTGDGSQQAHQADLSLQGPLLDLSLALDGSLRGEDWRGRLLRAELDAQGQQWALQRPASLERLANGRITFGAHCFGSGPATLCAENQRLLPDPQLRYRLRDFPLESLAEHMPDNLNWQGEVNADLSLDLPAAGPSGTIRIDAGPGTLRMRDGDQWLDFPYATLALNSELTPKRVDSHLRFEGGELGELDVRLQVDPSTEAKAISGSFFLSDFDLSVARPFVAQVERLNGQLNGRGELSGSLQAPQVNGELRLSDAEIAGSELPVSFEQLQVRALIEGERVRVDGDWRSGEQGRGEIAGTLNWTDALDLDMRISGSRLPVIVEPYAELEVEPDLRLELAGDQLAVSGKVRVPRGDIQVRDLPPSTVRVSEDAVIVGTEAEDAQTPLAIRMDIDVEVGQDRLRFSGFGLTADLAGYLHIGDNLDARGELNLNNGRYRAYGQRLTIRRAQLLFTGVLSQPFLNIEAIRRIDSDNVIAGLRITGSAEQPRVDVFAEPAMSQEQALSYLVLGRPLGTDSGENNMLAQAALGLGLAGSASITGNVAQRLGIQDFQLDTEGSGTETSVVASGRLTDRLTLRYGVGVFESANTVALRYQLTKRIFLEAASGLASSLDVFYRRNF
ncbi:translocation/assembly module TamB [Pseudomonas sp. IC_126]|uniref:translocation/assembly module TamB domain-containing protein n=1 Tax=Pseudomonas sp. IC_126 TaxID=2547400 RepID=UPI001038B040|nr:translocation/assembly module TamB domain-containing protein [Pseudomonas sp. IC_126]TCD24689.1 translocation/assembly module TamB [Pseudomonas sp. IC_126]